jgi:hypothetical protein
MPERIATLIEEEQIMAELHRDILEQVNKAAFDKEDGAAVHRALAPVDGECLREQYLEAVATDSNHLLVLETKPQSYPPERTDVLWSRINRVRIPIYTLMHVPDSCKP